MFGDSIALTVDTVAKTMNKINQDNYSAEYLLRETLVEYRLRVRHTKTNPKNGVTYDRHNVEFVVTTFATDTVAEFTRKSYFVIEQLPSDQDDGTMQALADWVDATSLGKLLGWES